jgi:hypothetical protein
LSVPQLPLPQEVPANFGTTSETDPIFAISPPPPGCELCAAIGIFPADVPLPFFPTVQPPPNQVYDDPTFGRVYQADFAFGFCPGQAPPGSTDVSLEVFAALSTPACFIQGPNDCVFWPEGVPPLAYFYVCADAGNALLPGCPPGTTYDARREQCVPQVRGQICRPTESLDLLSGACVALPIVIGGGCGLTAADCKPPSHVDTVNCRCIDPPAPSRSFGTWQ